MVHAEDAQALAEKVTAEGANDFSARDVRALVESYTDDASVIVVLHGPKEVEKHEEGRTSRSCTRRCSATASRSTPTTRSITPA